VYGVTLHLGLHENKIWIEQDWTEDGIATELLKVGIPNKDIILGIYPTGITPVNRVCGCVIGGIST